MHTIKQYIKAQCFKYFLVAFYILKRYNKCMDTIKLDRKNCKIIAHRGVSGIEMENTCPAFVVAGNRSYYGIETDVHVTSDEKYIIYHDDNTMRLTREDYVIEETTFDVLRKLKVYEGDITRTDLCLPTLEDYITICKKYDKQSILELKNTMDEKHIVKIVEIVKEMGWFEKTTFISFSQENVVLLRKNFKDADIQFLYQDTSIELVNFMVENKVDADIRHTVLDKEYIDLLHSKGIKVNCWTVNDKDRADALIAMGVDFITTNILE